MLSKRFVYIFKIYINIDRGQSINRQQLDTIVELEDLPPLPFRRQPQPARQPTSGKN